MKTKNFVKRFFPIAAIVSIALAIAYVLAVKTPVKAEITSPVDTYEVTDFSTVADNDWKVNEASDTDNSSLNVTSDGQLTVNAANAVEQKYYGALLSVNPDATYKNFTFELTFKVNKSNGDLNRWIGIIYRTRYKSATAPVTGYIMNYRLNGRNAYSAVNAGKSFHDIDEVSAGGALADGATAPVISDGDYHTVTITMVDDAVAKHYIDGHLIREAKVADQTSHLGEVYSDGGFAVIVNSMEITIKSCKITPDKAIVPQVIESDSTIVTTYQDPLVKMLNAPTVVCDVTDKAVLNSLNGTKKPSNAILRFDKNENVITENGEVLGSFTNIYASLDHKIIPVVHIADDDSASALITYLTQKNKILDIAVMSDKPELVKKVRSAYPKIRGIIEYAEADFYTDGKLAIFDNIVGKTNANYAMTACIPQSAATTDNVSYIQARFKTVWVRPDENSETAIRHSVNSGAYGIVSSNFNAVYTVLESYPQNSLTRMPYNVAHRGQFSNTSSGPYENSLNAVRSAITSGATHLELDGHLTKDGHIVIMHDTSIDRTTTGSGEISDMTLEQIKQYRLLDGQEIPTLEQVFDVLCQAKENGIDVVFVFELKAGATIAQKIDSLLGTGEGQYDLRDNLVIITFNDSGDDLLSSIKTVMPETPTSHLVAASKATLAADLIDMGRYNCGYDMIYTSDTTPEFDKTCLTDRGIPCWYWTFDTPNAVIAAVKNGHLGLTNNAPSSIAHYYTKIVCDTVEPCTSITKGDEITVKAYSYNGWTTAAKAKICYLSSTANGWDAVATLETNGITLYTQVFSVPRITDEEKPVQATVEIITEIGKVTANIDPDGNVEFTPPEISGKKFVGLFADAEYTNPATSENISNGMTLYAKYADLTPPNDPDKNGGDLGLAVGLPIGIIGAAAIGIGIFFIIRKKRKA